MTSLSSARPSGQTPTPDATLLAARIALAIHEAVAVLYFADSSDYASALYDVVKALAPALWMQLEDGVERKHFRRTEKAANAARGTISRLATEVAP